MAVTGLKPQTQVERSNLTESVAENTHCTTILDLLVLGLLMDERRIIALFLTLYGCAIFVLHHYAGIEAAPLLGLSHKGHNYHGILKIGMRFTMIVFPCFILYIMTVRLAHMQ